jgi:hypothetical protein
VAPEIPAPRVPHRPAQHRMVRVAGVVVAGVELHPVAVRVAQVDVAGVGYAVPPGAALDQEFLVQRAEDVADTQHLMGFVTEEAQVVQARPVAAGEGHVVHGLLAEHPGRVQRVAVLDGLGQAEPERGVVLVGGPDVGHDDVEVVQPGGFGAVAQVVALLQAHRVVGGEEELHGEAQRILGPNRLSHARGGASGQARGPGAERGVERLGPVEVGRGADPEREPGRRGLRTLAQDQVVVGEFVVPAQVEGAALGAGDHETEQVDPEPPRFGQVGDGQFGVGGPDDVGGRGPVSLRPMSLRPMSLRRGHAHAPNRGTWVSPSGMWTIRDCV